jgi:hypothetical protein
MPKTPDTTTDPALRSDTPARHWVLIPCCGLFSHYRPASDGTTLVCTQTGGTPGCGRTTKLADIPQPVDGDELTVHNGVLQYGINPATTFTYSHTGEFGRPRTFTARELARYLSKICVWQSFQIDTALLEAARTGAHDHESGYGLKTRITRD